MADAGVVAVGPPAASPWAGEVSENPVEDVLLVEVHLPDVDRDGERGGHARHPDLGDIGDAGSRATICACGPFQY
ncbi:hypothetical protein ACFY8N_20895 [Streptomyces collinus]|uniref:hypothetical protein n=1 Tax=Streptomyces collinus TaxID=42684 RepID=UPI00368B150C